MRALPENKDDQPYLIGSCILNQRPHRATYYNPGLNAPVRLNIYELSNEYYISRENEKQKKVRPEKLAKIYKNLVIKNKGETSDDLYSLGLIFLSSSHYITNFESRSFVFDDKMRKLLLGEKIVTFHSPKEEREFSKNRIDGIYEKPSKKNDKQIRECYLKDRHLK